MWMVLAATLGLASAGVVAVAMNAESDAPVAASTTECAVPATVEREMHHDETHATSATATLATTTRPTSTLERPAPRPVPVLPAPQDDGDGLRARRLVVTHGIEDREPIDELSELEAIEGERVYAFIDLANTGENSEVEVIFEHETGLRVGLVELEVPAHVTRHRTWAYSSHVSEPGNWTLLVRDRAGRTVAAQSFEVR
jgi:hypothetical protein